MALHLTTNNDGTIRLGDEDGLPTLMTPAEVAEIFGVSASAVSRWGQTGRLASFRTPSGHRRYLSTEVEAVLNGRDTSDARTYDPDDPDNAPLTPEERRLDEIQARGLRERQADQERAGRRFDLFADSEWGSEHGNL